MLRLITFCTILFEVLSSGIYHENTKITFYPDTEASYFGYTVNLSQKGLLVGAPKAYVSSRRMATGNIFNCTIDDLALNHTVCAPANIGRSKAFLDGRMSVNYVSNDMWLGSTFEYLTPEKLLTCSPRYTKNYSADLMLMYGICFLRSERYRELIFRPLSDKYRLAFVADGRRKEYGDYGTHLNFYAYGQAGMSMKVTQNNSVIIGAPGLLQWTGGVVTLRFNQDEKSNHLLMQPTPNLYYTKDLGPDDYFATSAGAVKFADAAYNIRSGCTEPDDDDDCGKLRLGGYSVESGIFEPNGRVLSVGGAPRSKKGYGQVIIFEPVTHEQASLKIRQNLIGTQLGAYFGACLCALDIDGDGVTDLLVGAPSYVVQGGLFYDHGAVFSFMSVEGADLNYLLQASSVVTGSETNGARFGTTIAALGDVDGDGYQDVAIGAPWEDSERGAVYIYLGSREGLKKTYTQRIVAEQSQSFGIGLSKGYDVDSNNCNDLVIGAAKSSEAFLYRCVPTVEVHASIKVPDAMNLPHNATGFTALFCITVAKRPLWNEVSVDLNAKITIDPENNRATINGDSEYKIIASPGMERCDEKKVEVRPSADLSKPILLAFDLDPVEKMKNDTTKFDLKAARVGESSTLSKSFHIQLVRDCGEDMICTPWLVMTMEPLNKTFVSGTDSKLGVKLTILNKEEPAYGAKVNITLPMTTKRVPSECALKYLTMICTVPAPLFRNEAIEWDIELEYNDEASEPFNVTIVAELNDFIYHRNVTEESHIELVLVGDFEADFNVSGKSLPNKTLEITREQVNDAENINFVHFFEILNLGPSDWYHLKAEIQIPNNTNLSTPIKGCQEENNSIECFWNVPAKVSIPLALPLRFELSTYGDILEANSNYSLTTEIILKWKNKTEGTSVTTLLTLEPAPPMWPLIVGVLAGIIAGSLLLAAIAYTMYKKGFFTRIQREKLKELKEQNELLAEDREDVSSVGESHRELISDDSD